ncbi:hypothetical protein SAMN04487820_109176 [Actinopolyspora mzabensis]|uniref:Uncharacterized protein n=1 Tax=Actinopolyspora mzabensis TaxID=995066 RepID=A0A1G9D0K6_ACTMZ|nr:hypothetical protein [Actinopolyspora mzabensis]SDK57185.1 hypothetical protein SAMN04487820_109176 [Actinopolyspora mzabensis]
MNSESVLGWLEAMGVPSQVVSVAAERDDAWCLLRDDSEGKPVWDVFWREQGNRYDWARFSAERVACFYLFGRLTWTQALRGAVGPLDSGSTPPRGVPLPGGSVDPGSGPSESASGSSGSGSASSGSGSGSPEASNGPATPATGSTPAVPGSGSPDSGNPAADPVAGSPLERESGTHAATGTESDAGASHRDTSGTEQGNAGSERRTSGG